MESIRAGFDPSSASEQALRWKHLLLVGTRVEGVRDAFDGERPVGSRPFEGEVVGCARGIPLVVGEGSQGRMIEDRSFKTIVEGDAVALLWLDELECLELWEERDRRGDKIAGPSLDVSQELWVKIET